MLLMERSICFLIHADFAQEFQGEMKIAAVLPSARMAYFLSLCCKSYMDFL